MGCPLTAMALKHHYLFRGTGDNLMGSLGNWPLSGICGTLAAEYLHAGYRPDAAMSILTVGEKRYRQHEENNINSTEIQSGCRFDLPPGNPCLSDRY